MPRWPQKTVEERFWRFVDRRSANECWPWTGFLHPKGYGYFRTGDVTVRAHRFSWRLNVGPIPFGLHILHKCDNRCCVNPAHLFAGTNQDNVDDRHQKGRDGIVRGEEHGRAKLLTTDVLVIRQDERHPNQIAPEFGVSAEAIKAIKYRRNWKHVPELVKGK